MTDLKPCPFCGSSVHWDEDMGIVHDRIIANCIVDMVWPMESNLNVPKEVWIKKWNFRVDPKTPTPRLGRIIINDKGEFERVSE